MTKKDWKKVALATAVSVFVGATVLTMILIKRRSNRSSGKSISKKKLLDLVKEDIAYWSGVHETSLKGATKLSEWWNNLGYKYSVEQLQSEDFQSKHFWSAVYISNLIKRWGIIDGFKYSPSHSTFIVEGKEAKLSNDKAKAFHSYDPKDVSVEIGDIVGKTRTSGITYDNIYVGASTHTDVVYELSKNENGYRAYLIGGNLGQTVQTKTIQLDKDKKLINPEEYLVVMKNQLL